MKAIWSIEPENFRAFLKGTALQLQAGLARKNPRVQVSQNPAAEMIEAGLIEDANRRGLPVTRAGAMAVVSIAGPMLKNPGWLRWFGFVSSTDIRQAVDTAAADDEVEEILLRIDSPGGEVDGIAELGDAVAAAATVKRVVAQVDGMAASAAYWVASQADAIYAGRMDLIGSIGVRMLVYDFSEMFEAAGIEAVPIDTGEFKSTGAEGTEVTDNQRDYLQGLVDANFVEFKRAVMVGRGISEEAFSIVGDGRVFTAADALELGLIDRIQVLDETVNSFKTQAVRKARLALSKAAI